MRALAALLIGWFVCHALPAQGAGRSVGPDPHPALSHQHAVELGLGFLAGVRLGVGATAGLNSWLTGGVGAGYHLVGDFGSRIGTERNHSGADLVLSFGLRLGPAAPE